MKTLEEIKPVICKFYEEIIGKNPNELNFTKITENFEYIIGQGDLSTTIPRKYIDDLIDKMASKKDKMEAEQFILNALMSLEAKPKSD